MIGSWRLPGPPLWATLASPPWQISLLPRNFSEMLRYCVASGAPPKGRKKSSKSYKASINICLFRVKADYLLLEIIPFYTRGNTTSRIGVFVSRRSHCLFEF